MLLRPSNFLLLSIIGSFGACVDPGTDKASEGAASDTVAMHIGRSLQYDIDRMHDPATGRIPDGMRRKELAFAKTLPVRATAKSLNWVQRGPRNRGGRTRAFGVDVEDGNVLLAGSVTGGIWRSTDTGQSWQKTLAPSYIQNVSCLGQDVRNGHTQTWYAGTGENYGIVSGTSFEALLPGDGIFKSTDNGLSWQHLASTTVNEPQVYEVGHGFKHVNSIVVDPVRNDSDIVLAAVFNGVFRSNDGGTSWVRTLALDTSGGAFSQYTEVRVTSTGVFYAALGNNSSSEGLWRSTDGLTWTEISDGSGWPGNAERIVIGIAPGNENTVWFFAETPGTGIHGHSLWKYTFGSGNGQGAGGTWSNRSANLPNGTCTGYFTFDFGYINTQTSYDMCIAVDPANSDVVFIGGTSVYRSEDGWSTPNNYDWIGGYKCNANDPKDYVYPDHHPDQHVLLFDPSDATRLYSCNDGGVHVAVDHLADSVIWTSLNDTYVTSQFYTACIEEGNTTSDLILGGLQDNGGFLSLSADPADAWKYVHQDDGAYCAIPQGHAYMLTSSQAGRLYKKQIDANGDVLAFERIDPVNGTNSYNFINQLVMDPVDNNVLYWVSAARVMRNTDLASIPLTNNWYNRISTNWETLPALTLTASQRISALDMSYSNNSTLFFGTVNSHLYRCDSLHSATPVRTEISSPLWPANSYISCIAPNDNDPDELLMAFSNYNIQSIWHSTDGGQNWQHVSGNLEQNPDGSGNGPAVFWTLIYPTAGGTDDRYFAATSTGVYSTALLDGDNTVWEQEGVDDIGDVPVNMLTARGSDGLIVAATHGNGVYSANLPAQPIGVRELHDTGSLHVYPNPATDHLTIELNGTNAKQIEILDLNGRLLLRRNTGPNATIQWDLRSQSGSRVAAGTYIVRAGGRSQRVVVR